MSAVSQNKEPQVIAALRSQYSGGVLFGRSCLTSQVAQDLNSSGFMGSNMVVSLISGRDIVYTSPACVAAPLVHMVAKRSISIGIEQPESSIPVRIYAPRQLSLAADTVSLGDLQFVTLPQGAAITCRRLILQTTKDEEPEYFELVKTWTPESTEIEVKKSS